MAEDNTVARLRVLAEAATKRAATTPNKVLREEWAMVASHYLDLAEMYEKAARPGDKSD